MATATREEQASPQAKQLVEDLAYVVVVGKRSEPEFLAAVARGLLESYEVLGPPRAQSDAG